jgi:hypothetical protein
MRNMPALTKKLIDRVYPPSHLAFYLQRTVLNSAHRQKIAAFLAKRLPAPTHTASDGRLRIVSELERDGFSYLHDLISPTQIGEILSYLADKLCYDRWRRQDGLFHVSDAPINCHVAPYQDAEVLACPHVLHLANHPDIIASTERLFGCKPTLSQLSLWWSLPGHAKAEDAEMFHRDVDEWHFIKLFVYLTDVDSGSGPHVFVKGSPRINKLLPIRRYEDVEIEQAFGRENVIEFVGKAGTAFLENTFGFHKGQLPTSRRRLLFQAQYSLFPIGIYKYDAVPRRAEHEDLDPYVNRLYLR